MITEFTLLTTLALHHLLIGSALTVILLGFSKLIKTSAELRSWLWMTVFLVATLVPFTLLKTVTDHSNATSTSELAQPISSNHNSNHISKNNQTISIAEQLSYSDSEWHVPSVLVYNFQQLLTLLVLIWLAGSLWRCISVLRAFINTRIMIAACQPLSVKRVLKNSIGTNLDIYLYSSNSINTPLVTGLISPKIILPGNIVNKLEPEQLAPIVLHEQAHIKRNDILFGLMQELIAIIFWWSPVIRIMNKKIHIERELACDLRAAKQLNNGKQYAQSLIDCAKLMITENRSILAMGLFSQKKELSQRISHVLRSKDIKIPNILLTASICMALTVATAQAAQILAPKINVKNVQSEAIVFSFLTQRDGEKLIQAVSDNDIEAIKKMQSEGININSPAIGDGTALMIAIKKNNPTMVQALIELGADVNQPSLRDGNPLINAAMLNNIELARLLIEHGADVNVVVPRDETPLINATRRGYLNMSQFLVENGADVNLIVNTGPEDGNRIRSPLNMARTQEVKDYLIAKGARAN